MSKHTFDILLGPLVRLFYPRAQGASAVNIFGSVFFMQKIVGLNRFVPWPVHFTSRVLYSKRVRVGLRSFPGWSQGCYIQGRNGIEIGYNLRMGPNVGLISANHSPDDYDRWVESPPIRIGNNVWIGMNSVVMPGIRIGNNVIVGANSVVTRDLPSNVVAAGNPCRVMRDKGNYKGRDYGC